MHDFLLPLKLAKDKIGFLEFFYRIFTLLINPFISKEPLRSNPVRLAIVDLALSFPTGLVIVALIPSSEGELRLFDILKVFNIESWWATFIYYLIAPSLTMLVFYVLLFKYRYKSSQPYVHAYILVLHYIRIHSLTIVLSMLGLLYILHVFLNKGQPVNLFEQYVLQLPSAKTYAFVFFFLLFWLYIIPVMCYLYRHNPKKNILSLFKGVCISLLVVTVSLAANSVAQAYDPITKHSFNFKNLCEALKEAPIQKVNPYLATHSGFGLGCVKSR
ncbi:MULTISPECIES: hypothetical protein [Vibrio]|uniref:hypothetical protein n=1 Tax=Vibrio TaxID=662 RepID=UPI0007EEF1FB|nr:MULTISPECIES: hypothetical protein [Vibrio]OBT29554.1 hypothetical protein A9263_05690 [Vibrio cyclitrophicus]PMK13941.1 hypothetical protein BCU10_17235 [Vibrio splendidus]